MQFKSYPTEFKVDEESNIFEGYASIFGNKDAGGDIIQSGAFKKTLREGGNRVKVLWQHDTNTPIGKPMEMEEDAKGLRVKAKISETQAGKDALKLMRDGVINELSIGYDVVKDDYDENRDARLLKEVRLWEFSPVTFAMNQAATITGVKSIEDIRPALKKLVELNRFHKEGRTLSQENYSLIQDAIMALEELLNNAESSNDTHYEDDDKSGDHFSELKSIALAGLKDETNDNELLNELRKFSKQLREGE